MTEQKNGKFEMPVLPYAAADLAPACKGFHGAILSLQPLIDEICLAICFDKRYVAIPAVAMRKRGGVWQRNINAAKRHYPPIVGECLVADLVRPRRTSDKARFVNWSVPDGKHRDSFSHRDSAKKRQIVVFDCGRLANGRLRPFATRRHDHSRRDTIRNKRDERQAYICRGAKHQ